MSKRWAAWVIVAAVGALMAAQSFPAVGRIYVAYYDCTDGKETALTLSSLSAFEGDIACSIAIFDPTGAQVAARRTTLTSYSSTVLFLSEDLGPDEATRWGIVLVDCPALLSLSVWIRDAGSWIAAENIVSRVLSPDEITSTYYWFTLNHANTHHRTTGIAVLNPHSMPVAGAIWVHNAAGEALGSDEFVLDPQAAIYFSLEREFARTEANWGVIDIRATAPILVVGEYFDAAGELIDVDVVTTPYYQQISDSSSGG